MLALTFASPAGGLTFNRHIDFCLGQEVTAKQVRPFAEKVWRQSAWERAKLPQRVREAHWQHVRCAKAPPHREAIWRFWSRQMQRFKAHRKRKLAQRAERRRLDALTPFGAWAIPGWIVTCESGGDFRALNPSSDAGGAYQIIPSTWAAYGGTAYAPMAHEASPEAQHIVAGRIWASDGPGAWVCAG